MGRNRSRGNKTVSCGKRWTRFLSSRMNVSPHFVPKQFFQVFFITAGTPTKPMFSRPTTKIFSKVIGETTNIPIGWFLKIHFPIGTRHQRFISTSCIFASRVCSAKELLYKQFNSIYKLLLTDPRVVSKVIISFLIRLPSSSINL